MTGVSGAERHVLAAIILGIAGLQTSTALSRTASLPVLPPIELSGVEDMAVMPGGRWLIGSKMSWDSAQPEEGKAKKGLYAIDRETGRYQMVYPIVSDRPASGRTRLEGSSTCTGELPAADFDSHGVTFRPGSDRGGTLYVVNHGELWRGAIAKHVPTRGDGALPPKGRESIEIFDVAIAGTPGAAPRLTWQGCVPLPPGGVGNAVGYKADGTLYATFSPLVDYAPMRGDVRYWTHRSGWKASRGSDAQMPTGLAVSADGTTIYVSSFIEGKVFESAASNSSARRELELGFGVDNLSWAGDGALLATGHGKPPAGTTTTPCNVGDGQDCAEHSYLARIDPERFIVTCKLDLGPGGSTVATPVGKYLWLGGTRAPNIWRIPASWLGTCPQYAPSAANGPTSDAR